MKTKKIFLSMVAAALLPTMEVAAQNGKKVVLDSLIHINGPHTEFVSDEDFHQKPYEGTELRAGFIMDFFSVVSGPVEIDRPSDCSVKYELNTVYGTNVYTYEDDFSSVFDDLEDAEGVLYSNNIWLTLHRGGVYKYNWKIPAINRDKDVEVIFKDVPNFRSTGRTSCYVGEIGSLNMTYIFNTGYPYSQDTLQAENKVNFQLFYVDKDSTQQIIDEREKSFSLLDREKPLLAGIDSVEYDGFGLLEDIGPGQYYLKMNTDWNNIERIMRVEVKDTLRAEIKLDKELYVKGVDKKAKVSFKMDYGYPYIHAAEDEQLPTVRFFTELRARFKEDMDAPDDTCIDSLYTDSLIVADSKFAEEHVYLEKEIEIDLDNILSNYVFENDVDTLSLRAMICYEGNTQKEEVLKLLVKRNATSVTSISTDNDGPSEYYNLNGQRITAPADKRQLYIERRNGKATVRVRR